MTHNFDKNNKIFVESLRISPITFLKDRKLYIKMLIIIINHYHNNLNNISSLRKTNICFC